VSRGVDAAVLGALAQPVRLKIVELMREGPLSVGEIAQRLGLRQPQASKHLRVLSDAGLVRVQADANRRIYSLRQESFEQLEEWIRSFTRLQQDRYERLEAYLAQDDRGR